MAKKQKMHFVFIFLQQSSKLEVVSGGSRVKTFLVEIKNTLSQVNFNQVMQALQSYKASDDLQALLAATAFLSEERSNHNLLRGGCSYRCPGERLRPGASGDVLLNLRTRLFCCFELP